jgi:small GTP-binding protein
MGSWFSRQPLKIIVLGLDGAGKTTLTTRLIGDKEEENPLPTVGFQVKHASMRGLDVSYWDIGGQDKTRQLWESYVLRCDMLVYIIDLQDEARLELSFSSLDRILSRHPVTFSTAPVIVFGNKVDTSVSPGAHNMFRDKSYEIFKKHWEVTLKNIHQRNNCIAFTGSAKTGLRCDKLKDVITYELEENHTGYLWRQFRNFYYT